MAIQQPIKSFRPLWQFAQPALLQCLGERIKQIPDVPSLEFLMRRISPAFEHVGNHPIGTDSEIDGANDEVVGNHILDSALLVRQESNALVVPFAKQLPNCPFNKEWKVAANESGMLSGELDLATEGQVVANENLCASSYSCGETLVMGISQPNYPAVIVGFGIIGNFDETEISRPIMGEGMRHLPNIKIIGQKRLLDYLNQLRVRNWRPCIGSLRCSS